MPEGRFEVKLAGIGGQGIVLAGRILALGAFLDGRWVTCIQSYSARVRGAPVESDVIISERKIAYPFVRRPDFLVALAEPAFRFAAQASLTITDESLSRLRDKVGGRLVLAPIFRTAREISSEGLSNMVALGLLTGLTGIVSPSSMEEAIARSVGARYLEKDLEAFRAGLELAHRTTRT